MIPVPLWLTALPMAAGVVLGIDAWRARRHLRRALRAAPPATTLVTPNGTTALYVVRRHERLRVYRYRLNEAVIPTADAPAGIIPGEMFSLPLLPLPPVLRVPFTQHLRYADGEIQDAWQPHLTNAQLRDLAHFALAHRLLRPTTAEVHNVAQELAAAHPQRQP